MAFSKTEIVNLYHKRAKRYDVTANLYYLAGFREYAYRREAVEALRLAPGSTVVELGCGTGLNFDYLRAAVGRQGQIVGVDLTREMLEQASKRVSGKGWRNVRLVNADASSFSYPAVADGIISTFALSIIPDYEAVIEHAAEALAPGKRMVVFDISSPKWAPGWLVKLGVFTAKPFGATSDVLQKDIPAAMRRHFTHFEQKSFYGGVAFVATGWND